MRKTNQTKNNLLDAEKENNLSKAFELLTSLPSDFFSEGRIDQKSKLNITSSLRAKRGNPAK